MQGCSDSKNGVIPNDGPITLVTPEDHFIVGQPMVLKFETLENGGTLLMIANALGTATVDPVLNKNGLEFHIPSPFAQKAGRCKWKLLRNQEIVVSGKFHIIPQDDSITRMETYLGPRSISAGEADKTMLVVAPTDRYDNPLADGTPISVKHIFGESLKEEDLQITNLIGWTNISAPKKAGRILSMASHNNFSSKELTTIVYPGKATDFTIDFQSDHTYADGNQVITFSTSGILDDHGNLVSDGTLVNFIVENKDGVLLRTMGTTIDGVAKGKLLHPSKKDTWTITAYITGAAKGTPITVDFNAAVTAYEVNYDHDKRTVIVGPIQSFMGQKIPDGLEIDLSVYNAQGILVENKQTTSKNGIGAFFLDPNYVVNGKYKIAVQTAGIEQIQTFEIQ
ncbi:hypothetical protein [Sediminicola sp. 1XM1-17]|uniref:hypothetical protein n=1 Tax=Sediminicola sp. 1XM1-17 TaxID=3127702 RepID=UPI0030780757